MWKDNLSQLVPYFGSIIFEEYEGEKFKPGKEDFEKRLRHQLEMSFSDADSVYVLIDQNQVVGYSGIFHHPKDPALGILLDIVINPNYRGKGYANILYKGVFANESLSFLVGFTKTPQAVKARDKAGREFGFQTYYGDQGLEREDIKKVQQEFLDYYKELVSAVPVPDGFAFLKGEQNVLPKLKPDQVKFDTQDPLNSTFQKLLDLQAANDQDTAVGFLVSVKE